MKKSVIFEEKDLDQMKIMFCGWCDKGYILSFHYFKEDEDFVFMGQIDYQKQVYYGIIKLLSGYDKEIIECVIPFDVWEKIEEVFKDSIDYQLETEEE